MTKLRLTGMSIALVLAALVGGTLISAVAAAPAGPVSVEAVAPAPTPAVDAKAAEIGKYCETFRSTFAAELGVSQDKLTAAAKAAIGATIDQAVADGKLTPEMAAKAKDVVAKAEGDGCKLLSGWGSKLRGSWSHPRLNTGKDAVAAAATALGMTTKELWAEWKTGASLKEIAAAKGVSYDTVSGAVTAAVKTNLDEAVKAGTLTQEKADKILARTTERLANGWPRRAKAQDKAPASS